MQKFSGSGVFQSQQVSVEGLPVQGRQRRLALGSELAGLGLEVRAIDAIAHQGVADMGKVHPDLMGPPVSSWQARSEATGLPSRPLKAACSSQ